MADPNLPSWAQKKPPIRQPRPSKPDPNLPSWAGKTTAAPRKPGLDGDQQAIQAIAKQHPSVAHFNPKTKKWEFKSGWKMSGGFFNNLERNVEDAVLGLPAAAVQTVKHPIRTGEQLVDSYKYQYGPLFKGDFDEFYKRFHANPLGPILDALAVVGVVGARGVALGSLPAGATAKQVAAAAIKGHKQGPRQSLEFALPSGEKVAGRTVSRNALRGARQKGVHNALNELHPETRVIGEFARAARELKKQERTGLMRNQVSPVLKEYLAAWGNLGGNRRTALNILMQVPLREDLARWRSVIVEKNDPVGMKLVRALDDKDVLKLYDAGLSDKKLARAYEASRSLGAALEGMLGDDKLLSGATAEARRFLPMQYARGAARGDDGDLIDGAPLEQLQAEISAAGRPEPVYVPHTIAVRKKKEFHGAGAGGGIAEPDRTQRMNQGVLFKAGLLAIDQDVLSPKYMREIKLAYHDDLHQALIGAAKKIDKDGVLPAGWRYIRVKRGERIPHTVQRKGELSEHMDDAFPVEEGHLRDSLEGTINPSEAMTDGDGFRYAVPEKFAKELAGEFARSSKAAKLILERPLQVWRAIVLNLRVGWLVNNIVGNHFLYAVKLAGVGGLQGYLRMVYSTKGIEGLRQIVNAPETKRALTDDDLREVLPELVGGTFIGTQTPTQGVAGRVNDFVKVLGLGLAPLDRRVEAGLRRAAANAVIGPEAKRIMKSMPQETRSFRAAAKQALDDPKIRREVVDEVNDALGNFLDLSPAERGIVRNLVPFWAWYKAIAIVTLKMPVNNPVRTAFLAQLGMIGQEWADERIGPHPSYLRGAVPAGDGILKTRGFNPYSTNVDTVKSLTAFVPGLASREGAQKLLSEFNPFLGGTADYVSKVAGGRQGAGFGLPAEVLKRMGEQLPFARIANPRHPRRGIYDDYGRLAELLGFMGVPFRHLNENEARRQQRQGR